MNLQKDVQHVYPVGAKDIIGTIKKSPCKIRLSQSLDFQKKYLRDEYTIEAFKRGKEILKLQNSFLVDFV